jgi:hypothetical protein
MAASRHDATLTSTNTSTTSADATRTTDCGDCRAHGCPRVVDAAL